MDDLRRTADRLADLFLCRAQLGFGAGEDGYVGTCAPWSAAGQEEHDANSVTLASKFDGHRQSNAGKFILFKICLSRS